MGYFWRPRAPPLAEATGDNKPMLPLAPELSD